MEDQGYVIKNKTFYQDNRIAMQIEKNGRFSSSEKSRHLNIMYFFIKDILKGENIVLKDCPTNNMIADPANDWWLENKVYFKI